MEIYSAVLHVVCEFGANWLNFTKVIDLWKSVGRGTRQKWWNACKKSPNGLKICVSGVSRLNPRSSEYPGLTLLNCRPENSIPKKWGKGIYILLYMWALDDLFWLTWKFSQVESYQNPKYRGLRAEIFTGCSSVIKNMILKFLPYLDKRSLS